MSKTKINLPDRKGWPVRVDGETLESLKVIQGEQVGTPSYTSIVAQAVKELRVKVMNGWDKK